jgi:hypothetical protein
VLSGGKRRRLAPGCIVFASYGASWLPKALVEAAHVKIWTEGQFGSRLEASMGMTMGHGAKDTPSYPLVLTNIKWLLEKDCGASPMDQ